MQRSRHADLCSLTQRTNSLGLSGISTNATVEYGMSVNWVRYRGALCCRQIYANADVVRELWEFLPTILDIDSRV